MNTIIVAHDETYKDVEKMMKDIDYVASHSKTFEGDFTLYCEANSPLAPVLKEAGLPFSTENFPTEPDYVISFIYDLQDGSKASSIAMNQWESHRPVWAFQVVKS